MRPLLSCVLALAAVAGGCNPNIEPEPVPCPSAPPTTGDACRDLVTASCTYADACTGDRAGVIALCTSGRWEVAYDSVLAACPKQPVADGDPCPCVTGGRQKSPCSWSCSEGGSVEAACDATTQTWKRAAGGAATCTVP